MDVEQSLHNSKIFIVTDYHVLKRKFCDTCSSTFNRKDSLIRHKDKCKGDSRLICKICDIGFTRFSNLKRHIERYHAGEKNDLVCSKCGKRYNHTKLLAENVGKDITRQSC